jgi:hypothetical protein
LLDWETPRLIRKVRLASEIALPGNDCPQL